MSISDRRTIPAQRAGDSPIDVRAGLLSRLSQILREPLLHFFIVGLLFFVGANLYRAETDPHRIVVSADEVRKLALGYSLQFGALPSAAILNQLIERHIDDETLAREARARGLDQDDEIVRRRLIQKMTFLEQDLRAPAEPSEAQVEAFYKSNASRYEIPSRVTFSHIYFSPDRGGDEAARARAIRVLATLDNARVRAPELGDNFPDLYDYSALGEEQVQRLFGHSQFSTAIFAMPVGRWSGPFRSGFGWHLVYVTSKSAPRLPPLATIRATVRSDYLDSVRAADNRKAFDQLKAEYTVVRAYEGNYP
jgi:parvulin-like peptidyl-prolyl isomerase